MPAYVIVRVNVTDMETYQDYMKLTPATIEQYGGKFIARGGDVLTLEGTPETQRVVLLEFESIDIAQAWYNSDEYQSAKAVRENAAEAQFIVIESV
ncbi:MAG: DUF1330 domain-containing protein [Chloroflexota bacterium]